MTNSNTTTQNANQEQEAEVLYQRLGQTWYAFSIVGDEVFMSPITEDKIEAIKRDIPRPDPQI